MTRRSSLRAQAREIYEMASAQADDLSDEKNAPLPSPPPQGGREHAVPGAGEAPAASGEAAPAKLTQTALTQRARKLYEETAVPVREIARLAGVTERTLYKYAQKGGWAPRYAWSDRGGVAGRRRSARAQSAPVNLAPAAFAPVKGAGGRFIAREDRVKPVATGLKATDGAAAARAAAACARAQTIADEAQAEAAWLQWHEAFRDWLKTAAGLRDALAAHRARRSERLPRGANLQPDAYERVLERAGHIAVDCMERCQAQMKRCGLVDILQRDAGRCHTMPSP